MPSQKIEKIGMVTTQSVLKCTGKDWNQWVDLLNGQGGPSLSHKEIVALLGKKYKLSPWWRQGVATAYEIQIGRKIEGRNDRGEYATVATRTLPVDQKRAWKFLTSAKGIAIWLKPLSPFKLKPGQQFESDGGIFGEVRTVLAPKRARLTWQDTDWEKPTSVQILLVGRKNGKSILVFQHEKLRESRLKNQMRDHWKKILTEIAGACEG